MKRVILTFILIIMVYLIIGSIATKASIIPDDAIRIRIIANSNSEYDQNIKLKVKEKVEEDMCNMLKDTKKIY